MISIIQKYEGCKLQAYRCPAGKWTIGWGNTSYPDGSPVKQNDIITKEYADALLLDYVMKNIYPVFQKIPYDLTLDQRRAVASLVYNIGTSSFLRSNLFKAICNKDMEQIVKNWDWIKASGKVLKGLVKRRTEELYLFCKDL